MALLYLFFQKLTLFIKKNSIREPRIYGSIKGLSKPNLPFFNWTVFNLSHLDAHKQTRAFKCINI